VDAEARVGEDGVQADGVELAGVDKDPVAAAEGDGVAGTGVRPPDRVGGAVGDFHPRAVADGPGAGHVGADEIALHDRVLAVDFDAAGGVAGDEVAGPRRRSTDDSEPGADPHPVRRN
jgi:hypothetical protein